MSHDHHNHDHDHTHGPAASDDAKQLKQHWPVVAIVALVAVVFIASLFSFQVRSTEHVIVTRFGEPVGEPKEPGLCWKLPYPIEDRWHVDNRVHSFEGNTGVMEEVFTRDEKNIIITTWIGWRVADASEHILNFMIKVGTVEQAQKELTDLMRSQRAAVIGTYNFSQLVNVDPSKVKITEIEGKIQKAVADEALALYGIEVKAVGIRHIGFPESVTTKVFERMSAEREAMAEETLSRGKAESNRIRAEADKKREEILADADKIAKQERADGDAEAAQHYAVFAQNPELASFLRRLDSMRTVIGKNTTLIFDTKTPPFDLLSPDALKRVQEGDKQ